jgi:hypothetical protein
VIVLRASSISLRQPDTVTRPRFTGTRQASSAASEMDWSRIWHANGSSSPSAPGFGERSTTVSSRRWLRLRRSGGERALGVPGGEQQRPGRDDGRVEQRVLVLLRLGWEVPRRLHRLREARHHRRAAEDSLRRERRLLLAALGGLLGDPVVRPHRLVARLDLARRRAAVVEAARVALERHKDPRARRLLAGDRLQRLAALINRQVEREAFFDAQERGGDGLLAPLAREPAA